MHTLTIQSVTIKRDKHQFIFWKILFPCIRSYSASYNVPSYTCMYLHSYAEYSQKSSYMYSKKSAGLVASYNIYAVSRYCQYCDYTILILQNKTACKKKLLRGVIFSAMCIDFLIYACALVLG